MNVAVHQNLSDNAYRPGAVVLVGPSTAPGQILQVTNKSTLFEKAFFYGLRAVPNDGTAPTVNDGSVWAGEGKYCTDEVTNGSNASVIVQATAGASKNLQDYWVRIDQTGDALFVRYQ